eukprot:56270-Chlamydomonas_euryale.AAC.1
MRSKWLQRWAWQLLAAHERARFPTISQQQEVMRPAWRSLSSSMRMVCSSTLPTRPASMRWCRR